MQYLVQSKEDNSTLIEQTPEDISRHIANNGDDFKNKYDVFVKGYNTETGAPEKIHLADVQKRASEGIVFEETPEMKRRKQAESQGLAPSKNDLISGLSAVGGGLTSGATLGAAPQIAAGIEKAIGDKRPYEQIKEEEKIKQEELRVKHPYLYGGSEMLGGIAPAAGLTKAIGAIGKGASYLKGLTTPAAETTLAEQGLSQVAKPINVAPLSEAVKRNVAESIPLTTAQTYIQSEGDVEPMDLARNIAVGGVFSGLAPVAASGVEGIANIPSYWTRKNIQKGLREGVPEQAPDLIAASRQNIGREYVENAPDINLIKKSTAAELESKISGGREQLAPYIQDLEERGVSLKSQIGNIEDRQLPTQNKFKDIENRASKQADAVFEQLKTGPVEGLNSLVHDINYEIKSKLDLGEKIKKGAIEAATEKNPNPIDYSDIILGLEGSVKSAKQGGLIDIEAAPVKEVIKQYGPKAKVSLVEPSEEEIESIVRGLTKKNRPIDEISDAINAAVKEKHTYETDIKTAMNHFRAMKSGLNNILENPEMAAGTKSLAREVMEQIDDESIPALLPEEHVANYFQGLKTQREAFYFKDKLSDPDFGVFDKTTDNKLLKINPTKVQRLVQNPENVQAFKQMGLGPTSNVAKYGAIAPDENLRSLVNEQVALASDLHMLPSDIIKKELNPQEKLSVLSQVQKSMKGLEEVNDLALAASQLKAHKSVSDRLKSKSRISLALDRMIKEHSGSKEYGSKYIVDNAQELKSSLNDSARTDKLIKTLERDMILSNKFKKNLEGITEDLSRKKEAHITPVQRLQAAGEEAVKQRQPSLKNLNLKQTLAKETSPEWRELESGLTSAKEKRMPSLGEDAGEAIEKAALLGTVGYAMKVLNTGLNSITNKAKSNPIGAFKELVNLNQGILNRAEKYFGRDNTSYKYLQKALGNALRQQGTIDNRAENFRQIIENSKGEIANFFRDAFAEPEEE